MKKYIILFLNNIMSFLGSISSHILSINGFYVLRESKFRFHSAWISSAFLKCGRNLYIEYPIRLSGSEFIKIGDNFIANARLRLEASYLLDNKPEILIGNNVNINFDCHIGCVNKISIGNNVLIASKVFITDHGHGEIITSDLDNSPLDRKIISKGSVIIHDNVWIGQGVVILSNVNIGENSIIGANSVITKDIPPNSVVAGCPAKIIRVLK